MQNRHPSLQFMPQIRILFLGRVVPVRGQRHVVVQDGLVGAQCADGVCDQDLLARREGFHGLGGFGGRGVGEVVRFVVFRGGGEEAVAELGRDGEAVFELHTAEMRC